MGVHFKTRVTHINFVGEGDCFAFCGKVFIEEGDHHAREEGEGAPTRVKRGFKRCAVEKVLQAYPSRREGGGVADGVGARGWKGGGYSADAKVV